MEFQTKQELYDYLNSFDFDAYKDTPLSSVFFLTEYNDVVEPLYFSAYEDVWFETDCNLLRFPLADDMVMDYVKGTYFEEDWQGAYTYESMFQQDGWHYEIENWQCTPFLPEHIKLLKVLSERECLEWLLEHDKCPN